MKGTLLSSLLAASLALGAEVEPSTLYEVSTEGTSTVLKAGDCGSLVLVLKTKPGAHISDEAPLKIELKSRQAKLEKSKLTLADSKSQRAPGQDYVDPRFEVGFTPQAHGPTVIDGQLTFFVCTEKLCLRQSKTLRVEVDVQ